MIYESKPSRPLFFDLQRFNDGVQPTEATPNTVQAEQPTEYKMALDENRRLVRVPVVKEQPKEQEPPKEEVEEEPPKEEVEEEPQEHQEESQKSEEIEQAESPQYTPDELKKADFSSLDPKRLPPELQPYWKSMFSAYIEKTKNVANDRKLVEQLAEELKKSIEKPKEPSPVDYYVKEHQTVIGEVERLFNLDKGTLDPDPQFWTPEQRLAYDDIRYSLREMRRVEMENQRKQIEIKQSTEQFADSTESRLRQIDNEAYEYAIAKLQSGEVLEKDKIAVVNALQKGDSKTIDTFFEKFRREYRGIKSAETRKKEKPPVLETSGQGNQPQNYQFDYTKFRTAPPEQKVKMIAEWRRQGG